MGFSDGPILGVMGVLGLRYFPNHYHFWEGSEPQIIGHGFKLDWKFRGNGPLLPTFSQIPIPIYMRAVIWRQNPLDIVKSGFARHDNTENEIWNEALWKAQLSKVNKSYKMDHNMQCSVKLNYCSNEKEKKRTEEKEVELNYRNINFRTTIENVDTA